jgi:hypothetical protein
MSIEHLTEEELQSYTDGRDTENMDTVESHLQTCVYCRQKLAAYQFINEECCVEPEYEFSMDFEDVVIERILATESERFLLRTYTLLFLMITCTGLAICILAYQYRYLISLALNNGWIGLNRLYYEMIKESEGFSESFEILLFAGIIFLIFRFFDSVLLHPKHHKTIISKII